LGGEADGNIGMDINLDFADLRVDKVLFSESPGFVFEVKGGDVIEVKEIFENYDLDLNEIGKTTEKDLLLIKKGNKEIVNLKIEDLRKAWTTGVPEAMG